MPYDLERMTRKRDSAREKTVDLEHQEEAWPRQSSFPFASEIHQRLMQRRWTGLDLQRLILERVDALSLLKRTQGPTRAVV